MLEKSFGLARLLRVPLRAYTFESKSRCNLIILTRNILDSNTNTKNLRRANLISATATSSLISKENVASISNLQKKIVKRKMPSENWNFSMKLTPVRKEMKFQ